MATFSYISTDSILRHPTALPFPTQAGIVSNCESWMRAFDKGDFCAWFAGRGNTVPREFYKLNPFLGLNGENCNTQFWASYWYCVGTSKDGSDVVATSAGILTVSTSLPTTKTDAPAVTTKPTSAQALGTTTPTSSDFTQTSNTAQTVKLSSVTPATSSAAAGSTSIVAPAGSTYLGCAAEPSNGRALNLLSTAGADMTIENCLAFCSKAGFPVAGLEYSSECFCGNAPPAKLDQTQCSMACSGNKAQICGGPNRLSVYQNNSLSAPAIPQTVGGSTYQGCFDESKGRVLSSTMIGYDDLTVDKCVGYCSDKGFPYAGVEYAQECWCAKDMKSGATKMSDLQCNMKCKGNGGQFCGGSGAVAVYKKGDAKRAVEIRHESPTVVKTIRMVRRGRFGRRETGL
ncbi:WSC domain-containing protein [Xylariales sp. AK1849]|nr:WSC domain-containing protein [Xylariales sp. AK1849]